MAKVYNNFDWNVSILVDAICQQKYIGNIITVENGLDNNVVGVNTIIPF